jgi:uncharacterized membrane protein YkoI
MRLTTWTLAVLTSCFVLCAGVSPSSAGRLDRTASGWLNSMCASAADDQDYIPLLQDAKISLSEGIELGLKEAKSGVVYKAELEGDKTIHWAIDVAQGTKVVQIDIDAKSGKVIETDSEVVDHTALLAASKITLVKAIEVALAKSPGRAVSAEFKLADGKSEAHVKVLGKNEKIKLVLVDAATGEILAKKEASKKESSGDRAFTDTFPFEASELTTTGKNPYFILEPGFFTILEGKEDGKDVRLESNVTFETKKVNGVECRVVVEKAFENGQLKEIARDYYAMSKKTASVYYFGEDVDNYKDGKVDNHSGSWLAGEKDAKHGLLMPGTILLGSRFYQECAPGVGMDRLEIISMNESAETPAGKFQNCLKIEETSPLEPGMKEYKLWAPGIGVVEEGGAKLVKYGMAPGPK